MTKFQFDWSDWNLARLTTLDQDLHGVIMKRHYFHKERLDLVVADEMSIFHNSLLDIGKVFQINLFYHYIGSITKILDGVNSKVPLEFNLQLGKPYTCEEVRCALFQMDPFKSPMPNEFSSCFYQKY